MDMTDTDRKENRYGLQPEVIEEIRQLAEKYDVKAVVLFGSRARGDFKEKSDIDLAFSGGDAARFVLDVNEETSTLLFFDIVNLEEPVQEELRRSIEKEGVLLYEKV